MECPRRAVETAIAERMPPYRRVIAGPHAYEQIPAIVERGKPRTADFYTDLEARLTESPFVATEQSTVADITALVTIDFATKALSLPIPDGNAATKRWYALVSGRPSVSA